MAAPDPLKQIDAEIAHHYAAIDDHRKMIMKLQEARETLEGIARRHMEHGMTLERHEAAAKGLVAASETETPKFRLTVQRTAPPPETKTNGHGETRKPVGRPPRGSSDTFGLLVRKFFSSSGDKVATSGFLMDVVGARTKSEKQRVYQTLHSMKKNGVLRRDSDGNYSRATH